MAAVLQRVHTDCFGRKFRPHRSQNNLLSPTVLEMGFCRPLQTTRGAHQKTTGRKCSVTSGQYRNSHFFASRRNAAVLEGVAVSICFCATYARWTERCHFRASVSFTFAVVPLHPGKAKAAAPQVTPKLTYRNGPLLTAVQVFTIFWGATWNEAPQSALLTKVNEFFDFILSSQLLDQLAEYSVPNQTISHGVLIGTITLSTPVPGKTVDDSAIQNLIQQEISAGTLPASTPNSLYFVFLPPGVTVTQGGSASCQVFCGYHDAINNSVFYAVMPYPGCTGCLGGIADFDALTSTTSHELCEAITDPVPGQGWYDDNNGEIGDICAWQTRTLGGYTIQLEWSNKAKKCV